MNECYFGLEKGCTCKHCRGSKDKMSSVSENREPSGSGNELLLIIVAVITLSAAMLFSSGEPRQGTQEQWRTAHDGIRR